MPRQLIFRAGFWPNLNTAIQEHVAGEKREQLLVDLTHALATLGSREIHMIRTDFVHFPHDPDDIDIRWVLLSATAYITFTFEGAPGDAPLQPIAGPRIHVHALVFRPNPVV